MTTAVAFRRIGIDAARELLQRDDTLVFDVRDANSYRRARIAAAQNINSRTLDDVIFGTPKHTPVLVYCYHGISSQTYAQTFVDFGFKEVYSLDGGYEAWRNAQAVAEVMNSAIANCQSMLTRWLQEHGFPANNLQAVLDNHTTPLMRACRLGDSDIVAELLRVGVSLNARNADGNNALWHACINGDLASLQQLLDARIDVDNQNTLGFTALMLAALTGKEAITAKLIAAGASLDMRSHDGLRAIDIASSTECGELLRQAYCAQGRDVA